MRTEEATTTRQLTAAHGDTVGELTGRTSEQFWYDWVFHKARQTALLRTAVSCVAVVASSVSASPSAFLGVIC